MKTMILAVTIAFSFHPSLADARSLALEGKFHLLAGDVPGLCPEKLEVKAEFDAETDQPQKLLVWDARKLASQGSPEITFANVVTWTNGENDPDSYDHTRSTIVDAYAENYQETCRSGDCRGQGYTWMKVAHTHGGDQLEYYKRMHCKYLRD